MSNVQEDEWIFLRLLHEYKIPPRILKNEYTLEEILDMHESLDIRAAQEYEQYQSKDRF